MFTNLQGTTRLCLEIGHVAAFDCVRRHFGIVSEAVEHAGGTLVKTMGDSAMAVFGRPDAALQAAMQAQRTLANAADPLRLKIGIDHGPLIAVTSNERFDYFGAAANVAAQLSGLSNGEDILISRAVMEDAAVGTWLERAGLYPEPHAATKSAVSFTAPDSSDTYRLKTWANPAS